MKYSLVIVLGMVMAIPAFSVERGLVASYPFSEAKGRLAKDGSGNGNDGEFKDGVRWCNGVSGGGIELDGRDGWVRVTNRKGLNEVGPDEATIEAWVNMKAADDYQVISSWDTSSMNEGKAVTCSFNIQIISGNVRVMTVFERGKTTDNRYNAKLAAGKWYYIAVVLSPDMEEVFVNGALIGKNERAHGMHGITADIGIGWDPYYNHGIKKFSGMIDEVKIYNRAKSPEEILEGYRAFSPAVGTLVQAIMTDSAPVMDGKLEESCWGKAVSATNFFIYDSSNTPAKYQTTGYILFDDDNLYVAMKCLEPDPAGIKSQAKDDEDEIQIFQDDVVEVMIDAGLTRQRYCHFAVNAAGTKFDRLRLMKRAESAEEYAWEGEWAAGAFIGDGYWSCEMKIPFYTLGITRETGPLWGINLCREKKSPPEELSSIGESGIFNNPDGFAILKGVGVDFSGYSCVVGDVKALGEIKDDKIYARLTVPIVSVAGTEKVVEVEKRLTGKDGQVSVSSEQVELKPGKEKVILLDPMETEPVMGRTGEHHAVGSAQVRIKDINGKRTLACVNAGKNIQFRAMDIKLADAALLDFEVNLDFTDDSLKGKSLLVEIAEPGKGKVLLKKEFPASRMARFKLHDAGDLNGKLNAKAILIGSNGEHYAEASTSFVRFTGNCKRLNNLVAQLLETNRKYNKSGCDEYTFNNYRDGWIFISSSVKLKKGSVRLSLNSTSTNEAVIIHEKNGEETLEVMRLLPAGEHKIKVWTEGKGSYLLVVKAIPEMVFSNFQYDPNIKGYGLYTWDFLERAGVLKNINTIIGNRPNTKVSGDRTAAEEWKSEGKKWLVELWAHEVKKTGKYADPADEYKEISADELYTYCIKYPGLKDPLLDGVAVDEFTSGRNREKLAVWTEAIKMIQSNAAFNGKAICPYFTDPAYNDENCRKLIDVLGPQSKILWEIYLAEPPTENEAKKNIESALGKEMLAWEKVQPGIREKMVLALGYMTLLTKDTQNVNPSVDWKVFMDMQFNYAANAPAFLDVYGIEYYTSGYADEETVRWAAKLYRHYGLEGRRDMLSEKYGFKYALDHIRNPTFAKGLEYWEVREAEPGSVSTKRMMDYVHLQGRWPPSAPVADTLLWMKRSGRAPNIVSQKISNLEPGRYYSLKMITADYRDICEKKQEEKKHIVRLKLDGVEEVPAKYFQEVTCSLRRFRKDFPERACMNFHWKVFRATGETATISISDWASETEPGGQIGQELIYNFIEIQPYLAD